MYPIHSLAVLCLVSLSTGAIFHRRGDASTDGKAAYSSPTSEARVSTQADRKTLAAPYLNSTLIRSHAATTAISAEPERTSSVLRDQNEQVSIGEGVSSTAVPSQPGSKAAVVDPSTSTKGLFFHNITSELLPAFSDVSSPSIPPSPSSVSRPASEYVNATASSNFQANATSRTPLSNATCTIHIPSASVDYWYPPTYSHVIGTMTTSASNFSNKASYTLVLPTTTFDISSALVSDFACTTSYSYMSELDWTIPLCIVYTSSPTAAVTSLAYRTAAAPWPTGGLIPVTDARLYDLYSQDMPSATVEITLAPNTTYTETSATPFVYFTAYEIESGNKTETVKLHSPQAYPYWLKGVDQAATAIGPLPEGFLERIPESTCDPGTLQATVTVLIVVDLYYENLVMADPFLVHVELSASGFDDQTLGVQGTDQGQPFTMPDWPMGTEVSVQPNIQASPTAKQGNDDNLLDTGTGGFPTIRFPPRPTEVTVGVIGTAPIILKPSSQVIVGSQTLQPGAPAITLGDGTPVSLAPSATAIVISGTTSQLPQIFDSAPPVRLPSPPVLTVGSSTLTPNAATQFFIAPGQTLSPGGTATIDGTLVSLAPSASFVVIGGSTKVLPPVIPPVATVMTGPPQIVIGSATFTAQLPSSLSDNDQNNPDNAIQNPTFVVSGQTLAPGASPITVSGTTLSLAPSGAFVVVNGVTSNVARPIATSPAPATLTIGDRIFTASPSSGNSFVIEGQALEPGGPAIIVSGTTISLAPSASFAVINGVTSTLNTAAAAQITPPPLTIGDTVFTALPGTGTAYVIGSMLLTPGGSVVVGSITISLSSGATALVINGQTSIITTNQPLITNPPILTIGSETYTAASGSGTKFIINGQTLTPGGTITVDGTTIILSPGATELVFGSSGRSTTTALFPATKTRSQSITKASSPSAGASGTNRQPIATSSRQGSAGFKLNADNAKLFPLIVLFRLLFANI